MVRGQISALLYKGFCEAIDWVYPPVCAACGEPGFHLCPQCQAKIHFLIDKKHPNSSVNHQQIVKNNYMNNLPYSSLRSLAVYDGVIREAIHTMKYANDHGISQQFSGWLVAMVKDEGWLLDLVVPVPLSIKRVKERGYNQSALIARPVSILLGVPYSPYGLKRIRNTQSQVGLSAEERRANVAGAFQGVPEIVSEKRVLLIDDVTTTGSTLEACAKALKKAGAKFIFCATVGAALLNDKNLSNLESVQV